MGDTGDEATERSKLFGFQQLALGQGQTVECLLQFKIGRTQIRGSPVDAQFELLVELAQRIFGMLEGTDVVRRSGHAQATPARVALDDAAPGQDPDPLVLRSRVR